MEKQECRNDYEEKKLVMSESKCSSCPFRYECKFMNIAMDEVLCGDEW